MKKLFTFSLIVATIAVMSNCSPKTGKKVAKTETKTETKEEATTQITPVPTVATSVDVVEASQGSRTNEEQITLFKTIGAERIESGKKLYESTCNKCHELYGPTSRDANGWVDIMKVMGPKAKLQQGPYMMISAYLVQHAKG